VGSNKRSAAKKERRKRGENLSSYSRRLREKGKRGTASRSLEKEKKRKIPIPRTTAGKVKRREKKKSLTGGKSDSSSHSLTKDK